MEIRKVRINPEIALQMLENNERNRSVSQKHVDYLARQMANGLWKSENGDMIRFSKSRRLLDGQHRLAAIIKANVTLDLYVIYNLDDDVFEYIDIGKNRHAGHVLQIAGVKNANNVGKTIKIYHYLKAGLLASEGFGNKRLSNHEVYELYKANPNTYDNTVKKSLSLYGSFNRVISASNIAAYYLYLKDSNANKVDLFFEKLCKGLYIDGVDDPVKRLRDKLTFAKLDKTKNITSKYLYIYMIKGWNYYIKGKRIKSISFHDGSERIPEPLSY